MIAYQTALHNVDKLLGLKPTAQAQEQERQPER